MSLYVDIKKDLGGFRLSVKFEAKDGVMGILGPSGCGKSMTLRYIAGVERPDEGRIVLDGVTLFDSEQRINLKPQQRRVGYLFQNYALFPNMTVRQNILCGAKREKDKAKREELLARYIELMQLSGLEGHYPAQLSGGQQQRVALARALVAEPALLLLDEPLSNLDAKLRESMRFEIKEIQRESGITVLYVTHDQTEAMAMSDRIVVINRGVIQQIGVPRDIYSQPANPFVADFVGKIEFLEGEVKADCIELDGCGQRLPYEGDKKGRVIVGVRPEHVKYAPIGQGSLNGTIKSHFYLGDVNDCRVDLGGGKELRVIADPYDSMDVEAGKKVSLNVREFLVYDEQGPGNDFRKILT